MCGRHWALAMLALAVAPAAYLIVQVALAAAQIARLAPVAHPVSAARPALLVEFAARRRTYLVRVTVLISWCKTWVTSTAVILPVGVHQMPPGLTLRAPVPIGRMRGNWRAAAPPVHRQVHPAAHRQPALLVALQIVRRATVIGLSLGIGTTLTMARV